jgi:membrane-associated phospholipid phosphatase
VKALFASQRRWLVPMVLAFAISGLGATIFKQSIERDRPFWFYSHNESGRALNVTVRTVPERPPMRVRGFVSGHTATSVALVTTATALLWGRRKRALLAGFWALVVVISFSRIYLADHWPLDVVAGAILGLFSSAAALGLCARGVASRGRDDMEEDGDLPNVASRVAGSA